MNIFERYMLLLSLSFFFGCMAMAIIGLYRPAPQSKFIYKPSLMNTESIANDSNATRQYSSTPQSILSFPSANISIKPADDTILCYLEDEYKKTTAELIDQYAAQLVANAQIEHETVEIYAEENGNFSVFVIGPNSTGQKEACEVARGSDWKILVR